MAKRTKARRKTPLQRLLEEVRAVDEMLRNQESNPPPAAGEEWVDGQLISTNLHSGIANNN